MKIRVKNFGPIHEADVELKPLTVFVGPSNTGKSYLAILLYSIAKTLGDKYGRTFFSFGEDLDKLLRSRGQQKSSAPKSENAASSRIARQSLRLYREAIVRSWEAEARHCFGKEWEQIASKNSPAKCDVEVGSQNHNTTLNLTNPRLSKLPSATPPLLKEAKSILDFVSGEKGREPNTIHWLEWSHRIFPDIADAFGLFPEKALARKNKKNTASGRVYYLPAVRGGVMQSHHTMVSALIKNASRTPIDGSSIAPLSGVLGDFLSRLIYIQEPRFLPNREHNPAFPELTDAIEKEVMGGAIRINKSVTEYPDFRYLFVDKNKRQRDIPLMSASSLVSELAPIVLFMRHYLSPGDIFIVEEPEAHLHPAAQREIAGVLADLANAGVYVVITTHSDVILEQLSNFIHAHDVPDAKVLNKKSEGRTVSETDAAAYSFIKSKSGKRGTVVKEILFDGDTGMLTEDHLDASSELYNETVDIFNRKQQREGKNDD